MGKKYAIRNSVRNRGIMFWGSPGAAKSVCTAKLFVRADHQRKQPVFVFDPLGTVSDYFLGENVPERVIYVDMAAKQFAVPFPILQRFGDEPIFDMAQRYAETMLLSDPALLIAPFSGYNPFLEASTQILTLLYSLDLPLIAAPLLIKNPDAWKEKLAEATKKYPEIAPSVDFLFNVIKLKSANTQTFRIKIMPFLNDPSLLVMCSAPTPGIDWQKVVDEGYTVLLDFRHVTNNQKKSFLMLWVFKTFLTFVRLRGIGQSPITLVIDELKALFLDPTSDKADSAIAIEFIQLLDIYARNYFICPILLSQDPMSYGPKVQQSLLGIGTQIIGMIHNTEAATLLASHLVTMAPGQYSTVQKDAYTAGQYYKRLKPFHFMVRPATTGGISRFLYPVHIENLVTPWTPKERIEEIRRILMERSGLPTAPLLSAITSRLARLTIPDAPRDIVKPHEKRNNLPPPKNNDDIY